MQQQPGIGDAPWHRFFVGSQGFGLPQHMQSGAAAAVEIDRFHNASCLHQAGQARQWQTHRLLLPTFNRQPEQPAPTRIQPGGRARVRGLAKGAALGIVKFAARHAPGHQRWNTAGRILPIWRRDWRRLVQHLALPAGCTGQQRAFADAVVTIPGPARRDGMTAREELAREKGSVKAGDDVLVRIEIRQAHAGAALRRQRDRQVRLLQIDAQPMQTVQLVRSARRQFLRRIHDTGTHGLPG